SLRADLPRDLARVLERCLEKDPERRIQTAKDVRNELELLRRAADPQAAPARPRRPEPVKPAQDAPSVAVLPFTSLSSDAGDSYFAEGLAEEMRSALAGVDGLKVAASVSPAVREGASDARALGRRLGVASILEASVRRQGARIRISARLSDTTSGFTLWSRTYDRELADVFETQSRIAEDVVQSLVGVIPGEREALAKRLTPTHDVAAFDDYLRGLHVLREANASGVEDRAIGLFGSALRRDSGFARAQAGICQAEIRKFENAHSVDAYDNARIACQRALTMDASLAEVALALGDLYRVQGEADKALAAYRAVAAPALRAQAEIGQAKVYASQRRHELATEHFRAALAASPEDAFVRSEIGYQHYLDGDIRDAIASFREAVALKPDDAGLWGTFGALCMEAGDNAEAARALQRSVDLEPGYAALSNLGLLRYQAGDYAAAATLQRQAAELNPLDFMVWANLGMALKAEPATADQARAAYREAATRAQRYLEAQPRDARATAALGLYQAELGDAARARELVRNAEALGTEPGEVALLNAETLAVLGDLEPARARLATARANGIAEPLIASNAVFKRLGLLVPARTSERHP
ncbi:tetratricopeptide repeat protein, partial [Dokdonella sp.]|uniref:tetratricopeptide repeat protein n=1 Tax=Dokdonella sp. TaxID=2291710 RepID=UPI002F3F21EE